MLSMSIQIIFSFYRCQFRFLFFTSKSIPIIFLSNEVHTVILKLKSVPTING